MTHFLARVLKVLRVYICNERLVYQTFMHAWYVQLKSLK
jgi:hypothetical protein